MESEMSIVKDCAEPKYARVVDGVPTITLTEHESIIEQCIKQARGYKELLEVLELMVNTYEEGGWPSATIVIAKAAIAKAKGESIR